MLLIAVIIALAICFALGVIHAAAVSARFKQYEADFATLKAKVERL